MAHTIVIFGASGDLTSRKLVPALYELHRKGRLPEDTRIVGFSRTEFTDETWREKLAETTRHFAGARFDAAVWSEFAPSISYHPGDIDDAEAFRSLGTYLAELDGDTDVTRVYYLSTAQQLNRLVHEVFTESQVYRIDHYLGKETVQNVLVLRFANAIFEPIWNRNYIDHVQITAAEEVAIGHRGGYYDGVGILRDMFQNHLLQLLTLTAMEAPTRFEAGAVRDEKVKVLRAIKPPSRDEVATVTMRGQYRKYRDEPGVAPDSSTATFGAVMLGVHNWRWQGVPFFLRSGKAMSCRTTQIVIQFRQPPHMMFESGPRSPHEANRLVIQVQPAEGIQLHFHTKVPDAGMNLRMTDLNFQFKEKFAGAMPEAYQRLLLDVMQGDASLFSRSDEVELAWGIIDPIQQGWENPTRPPMALYEAGGWGPPNSTEWMTHQGREWFDSCPVLR